MIPRGSTSLCLYDTRGLSDDSCDNVEMLKQWITKGVRHGKLIIRSGPISLSTFLDLKFCLTVNNFTTMIFLSDHQTVQV